MSVLKLPLPDGWRGSGRFLAWALVAALGAAAVILYGAVLAATRGNYVTTAVAMGAAIFVMALAAVLVVVAFGWTTARTTSDATGFTVWPDRKYTVLMLTGFVAAIPSFALFAVFAPVGAIEFASTSFTKYGLSGTAAIGAVLGISGLATAWRRGGVGHLKLTPAMIEVADILATRMYEWDDVVDVADHAETGRARRPVVLRLRNGGEEIISSADVYLPRGVALYWLVRHYWRHPEDRLELADSRAAERLRDGRFALD